MCLCLWCTATLFTLVCFLKDLESKLSAIVKVEEVSTAYQVQSCEQLKVKVYTHTCSYTNRVI